jgi:glutathione S-transferase
VKLYYDPIATSARPVMLYVSDHDTPVEMVLTELLAGETRAEVFLAINPNGAVPVLVDDELVLPECSSILKYLAELEGSPTYPTGLKARARVNAAMDWFNTGYSHEFNGHYVYPKLLPDVFPFSAATLAEMTGVGLERGRQKLTVLDRHMLGDQPFVCGPELTIADYLGAVFVGLSEPTGLDLSPWPNVAAWMARMRARPAWAEVHAAFYGFAASRRQLAAAG